MDIVERMPLESARTPTLMGCEHLHRYELAARVLPGLRVLDLCCGVGYGAQILAGSAREVVGVDYAAAAIETARAEFGGERVSFEVADALAYLRTPAAEAFDAIVCFEGLEHLPDVERVFAELRRLAERGARLVLSVPNSKTFAEHNEFHLTDFDYELALRSFRELGDVKVLVQFLAEGSLVTEEGGEVEAQLLCEEGIELEYANHYLAFVNVAPPAEVVLARMQLAMSPMNNRYVRALEQANTELARANGQLARGLLGSSDSAAASVLARVRSDAERQVEQIREELADALAGRAHAETLAREAWKREDALKARLGERGRWRVLWSALMRGR